MKASIPHLLTLVLLQFAWMPFAWAQPATEIPAAQLSLARELLVITGVEAVMRDTATDQGAMIAQQIRKVAPNSDPELLAMMTHSINEETIKSIPLLLEESAQIYARNFSEDELRGVLAFYRTPLGQKLIDRLPAVTKEIAQLNTDMAGRMLARLQAEIMKRFPPGQPQ